MVSCWKFAVVLTLQKISNFKSQIRQYSTALTGSELDKLSTVNQKCLTAVFCIICCYTVYIILYGYMLLYVFICWRMPDNFWVTLIVFILPFISYSDLKGASSVHKMSITPSNDAECYSNKNVSKPTCSTWSLEKLHLKVMKHSETFVSTDGMVNVFKCGSCTRVYGWAYGVVCM